ncbi:MAG TPA: amino acid racemase, partial [Burkholderiaceae bacterium]|nr:amino acid racemase [Burkholderiaceae bacterium]
MEAANTKGVIGVLGGMGPLATVDFMHKLLDATPAEFDQDHVPIVVSSIPQIPDRSAAFRGNGSSPLAAMIESGRRLSSAGAELVVVPCNTAHLWFNELRAALDLPMLHIVDAALEDVLAMVEPSAPIGLLCTDATLASGLYVERSQRSATSSAQRRWELPTDQEMRTLVMPGIEAVKAGQSDRASALLQEAA